MRKTIFLIRKEFRQIFRNTFLFRAIIAVPIVQMLILVPAITFELKRVDLAVMDSDRTSESRALVSRLQGSSFFRTNADARNEKEANALLFSGRCDVVISIPNGFAEDIRRGDTPKIEVLIDAINATSAQLEWSYINGIIRDYNNDILISNGAISKQQKGITVSNRFWYNSDLNYRYYMLPGVLVILVTAIGIMLAGLNMVKEKESGTIEQINVTPVRKSELIASKVVPFFIIGLVDLAFGLIVGKLTFNIPFEGSVLLLFFAASLFITAVLGLALFFSTMAATQQQYMFIAFFFVMVFVLMSGIFTPAESMPLWAQKFNIVNPVAYLMRINRMVMLKGSGFSDILRDLCWLAGLAVVFLTFAVRMYRKRS